jgi:hypothetical protein
MCSDAMQSNIGSNSVTVNVSGVCSPSSVVNGTVAAWPSCTISCNGGYSWNGSGCAPTEPCIPTGQPVPSGQIQCPTNSCFFWVSGLPLGTSNTLFLNQSKIGDSSLTWTTGGCAASGYDPSNVVCPAGSNGVGAGNYPDTYGNAATPGPFYLAANGTFDGIAIGKSTRVIIYQGTNFSGPVLFDQHGPMVVNDLPYAGGYTDTYGTPISSMDMSDWSALGGIFTQFPPSTRFSSGDPILGLSNAPTVAYYAPASSYASMFGFQEGVFNLWALGGMDTNVDGFQYVEVSDSSVPLGYDQYQVTYQWGFGPTSVQVICDP